MEFRYEEDDFPARSIKVEAVMIRFHAVPEITTPLTCDIVRNDDSYELLVAQTHQKQIVHVDIPGVLLISVDIHMQNKINDILFPFLKVADCGWSLQVVPSAVNSTGTR